MKNSKPILTFTLLAFGSLAACSATSTKSADVSDSAKSVDLSDSIRKSLDKAGYKDVSASHDRRMGVVTLGGHVGMDRDKSEAESIAKSMAGGQVVSNQIAVMPMGGEHMGNMGNHGRRMAEPHR